jgi:hypothetical protein
LGHRRGLCLGCCAIAAFGCSAPPSAAPRFVLTSGHESDPWQGDPQAETVRVTRIAEDGSSVEFLTADAPLTQFDIESAGIARYELEGLDAAGARVLLARSLLLNQGALLDVRLPLFVGTSGSFSRPPGELLAPGDSPALTLAAGRSLLVAGTADSAGRIETERYDFGAWAPVPRRVAVSCGAPSCRFDTLASVGSSLVLAIGTNAAVWFDLGDGSSGPAPLPAGLDSYAELVGGRAITGPDGSAYVVGATRPNGETSAVLTIAPDGGLGVMRLTAPRAGAAVTWLDGLVVVAGNPRSAGAERWVVGTTGFTALDYPPDPTVGAALLVADAHSVVRLGGSDPTRTPAPGVSLAVDCQSACTATLHSPAVALERATAVSTDGDAFIVAGTDATGQSQIVMLVGGVSSPIPLREPRLGAQVFDVWSLGELAVVGGHHADGSPALSVELFVP